MPKLSPHYRNDEITGLPPAIKKFLDDAFLTKLDNLKISNPKLLVVFSGGNALGKSTLAQKISRDLKGLVIENDAIKEALLEYTPSFSRDELNSLTWKYCMQLYAQLEDVTPNGLVVRDGVIDWYYDKILPIFEQRQYKLFTIAYDVTRDKQIAMIKLRGDKPTTSAERLIQILEDHDTHTVRFREHYTPDIVLSEDNLFDHERVVTEIKARLAAMSLGTDSK